jgi:hypothetical protein
LHKAVFLQIPFLFVLKSLPGFICPIINGGATLNDIPTKNNMHNLTYTFVEKDNEAKNK